MDTDIDTDIDVDINMDIDVDIDMDISFDTNIDIGHRYRYGYADIGTQRARGVSPMLGHKSP